ncbi:hypothetical protein HRG_009722 [Hirsutella rhossiliensis]|uniref:Uncharacterized protein n=1 Tax=Hirsutella rhossiliensis TaxID=111463 RepID=A0A9P8MS78_9HYPO|nr:uncharacterized protein HRG_09722 [Hirsutella rhossiliensis]KAH0959261.1 hypothetical protein HRG_09722 [Hirsutella rhossiliensis]
MSKNLASRRTILSEPQDWDQWIKELRSHTDFSIHHLLFEDNAQPFTLPREPQYADFSPTAADAATSQPSANIRSATATSQQKAYGNAANDYETRRKRYLYEIKLITAARSAITDSVSKAKLTSLREGDSLRQWLIKLETSTAPTPGFMTERIRRQYHSHIQSYGPRTSLSDWLTEWEEIMEDADLYFLTEALTGQWLRDLANVIRHLSDGYATVFQEESRKLDEEAAIAQFNHYKALRPYTTRTAPAPSLAAASSTQWTYQLAARKTTILLPTRHLRKNEPKETHPRPPLEEEERPHQRTEENPYQLIDKETVAQRATFLHTHCQAVGRYLMNYDLLDSKGTTDFARGQKRALRDDPKLQQRVDKIRKEQA